MVGEAVCEWGLDLNSSALNLTPCITHTHTIQPTSYNIKHTHPKHTDTHTHTCVSFAVCSSALKLTQLTLQDPGHQSIPSSSNLSRLEIKKERKRREIRPRKIRGRGQDPSLTPILNVKLFTKQMPDKYPEVKSSSSVTFNPPPPAG